MKVHNTVEEAVTKTSPKKEKPKKAKWLSEEALQTAEERREAKSKGEPDRYIQLNAEFQRKGKKSKKVFFHEQCKEVEENSMERLEISSRKLKIPREYFMQGWACKVQKY